MGKEKQRKMEKTVDEDRVRAHSVRRAEKTREKKDETNRPRTKRP
jgi:hypothetical protein